MKEHIEIKLDIEELEERIAPGALGNHGNTIRARTTQTTLAISPRMDTERRVSHDD
jgi:hypothetical protein